jgi:hypothetical protein
MLHIIASYLIDFFPEPPKHRDLTAREARWLVVLFVVAFWAAVIKVVS